MIGRIDVVMFICAVVSFGLCFPVIEWWPRWADILGAGLSGVMVGIALSGGYTKLP